MAHSYQERAESVVATFKEILGETICRQITDAQFQDLALLIGDAVAAELHDAAELVEEVAKKLRAAAGRPELGL